MKGMGIKYQLRLTTLIPVFVVALLFAVFYNGQFNTDLKEYVSRLGETCIRQLMPAAQLAMMRNDPRTLQGLINASTINRDVMALAFYDAEGRLIAYRGGKHSIHKPFVPPQFTGDYVQRRHIKEYIVNFIAPITLPKFNLYSNLPFKPSTGTQPWQADDILGWLSIDIDTQPLQIQRYQMYIITIFITLIGLLISLTIHYFLSRRIYLPIARLRRSMKQINRNEFETQINASSRGELGEIERGCAHLQAQYLGTIRDLNQHIETATEDLQQSLELLEEKNIELSLEKKKTEERSRHKSEFLANMSHEIRTPMNGVIGFTNVLLETKLDTLQLDYVKTIKSSAQDLLNLINDILDYSKIDAGKLHLDCIPLDLRACVDEVLTLAAPNAHKKGVDLIPSTEVNVPRMVLGDPLRIKQILTNLVSNAIKFTDHGYVLVHTSIEQESDTNYHLNISISDTGIGISKEDQVKLFQAFNQADTSITRRYGGTGLGLVICKKLAEAMQGRIVLTSEMHKGSTFSIKVILEKLAAYEVEKHQTHRFDHLKVLCFDDNSLQLESLCNGLGCWGIECVRVHSFHQLGEAFTKHKDCEIAFLNVNEGCEKLVGQLLKKQSIPCVLLSKWIIHDAQALGAAAFLYKPLNAQKLYDTVAALLNQSPEAHRNDMELLDLRHRLQIKHPNILIAEDNPVNRMLFNSLLCDLSTITAVEDGEQAVSACEQHNFDLLILDLQMPKLNGLKAAGLIRQKSQRCRDVPIILISANTSDVNQGELKRANIALLLQKPVDEKQLINHVLERLDQAEATRTPAIDWPLCIQKLSGNTAVAEEFLARFVQELYVNRVEFIGLLKQRDLNGLENAAHKLHGACCFCGVPRLQDQVVLLEQQAREAKNAHELKHTVDTLLHYIDEVIEEFDHFYQKKSVQEKS